MESSQTDASPAPIAELQINRVSASSHARDSRISEGNDMVFFSGFVESDIFSEGMLQRFSDSPARILS
jgi:hypothetical protein